MGGRKKGLYAAGWFALFGPRGLHKAETEKWWPVIKAANIKVE